MVKRHFMFIKICTLQNGMHASFGYSSTQVFRTVATTGSELMQMEILKSRHTVVKRARSVHHVRAHAILHVIIIHLISHAMNQMYYAIKCETLATISQFMF